MAALSAAVLHADDAFLAVTIHDSSPPAAPPVLPHVEGSMLGYSFVFAKLAPRVLVESSCAVQQGHDCGLGIPHVPIPPLPPNPMLVKTIAASSCKAMFGSARVLVQGRPVAAYSPVIANLLACADPMSLAVGEVPTALLGRTVRVGLTPGDLARGQSDVKIDQLLSVGLRAAFRAVAKGSVDAIGRRIVASWARWRFTPEPSVEAARLISALIDKQARLWIKKAVGKLLPTTVAGIEQHLPAPAVDAAAIYDDGVLDGVPLLTGAP